MLFRKALFIIACSLLLFLCPFSSWAQEGQSQTKRAISIELTNADIRDVLRLIAEVGNVNIIIGDDVKGRVTLKLTDVPWDQALDLVLQALGLGRVTILEKGEP